jgi:hypothetical protein
VRVFLSAAPHVRALCLPELVEGFEADVEDGCESVALAALLTPAQAEAGAEEEVLVARPTGRDAPTRPGVPWWEARHAWEWSA